MTDIAPGWYKDPAEPTTQRYWDGEGWVGSSLPVDATPPDGPLATGSPSADQDAGPAAATSGGPASDDRAPGVGMLPPPGYPPLPPGYPPGYLAPGPRGTSQAPGQVGEPGAGPYGAPEPPPGRPGYPPVPPYPGAPYQPGPMPPWPAGAPVGIPYVLRPIPRPHGFALAPLGLRFLARMIDIVAVLVLNVLLNGWLIYQWIQETSGFWKAYLHATSGSDLPSMSSRGSLLLSVITLLAIAIWIAYEVPFIANGGQTLGKRIMGIRVVPLEGMHRLGYGRALRRWVALGLPMVFWLISPVFILISPIFQLMASLSPALNRPLHLALHDRAAGTIVVEAAKPDQPAAPDKLPVTVGADRDNPDGGTK